MKKMLPNLLLISQRKLIINLFGFIALFLISQTSVSQIASDGLNNSSSLFTVSGGAYFTGNSASGDRPATSPFAAEGSHSYGVSNGTATLTSSNINTTGYSVIAMSMRLAAFNVTNNTNGLDGSDLVTVEISPNGGTTWYSTVTVAGNANAYWSYAAGTLNASTPYDGNSTPIPFASTAGNAGAGGYSTITVTSLPSITDLRVKITLLNNAAQERWVIDDFKITGTVASASEIEIQGNGANIASGDLTPTTADHTDFDSVLTTSGTIARTFTINNIGTAALTVGAISFSGAAAADFTVTTAPAASVANGGSATFVVTFDPSAVGVRNAVISIVNNDSDENPYTYAITGTGLPDTNVPDYVNLQFPTSATIEEGTTVNVFAQVFETGLTNNSGQGAGITGWIGYSATNTNPNTAGWTWVQASYFGDVGNNDEYSLAFGAGITPGSYFYASRFQIGTGPFAYGGTAGVWNNDSAILTVTSNLVNFANIQFPATANILQGTSETIFARVYEPTFTEAAGANGAITAWIGYNATNTNPNTVGWTWVAATYNVQVGNDDEYQADLGAALAPGTYYYASRFQKTGSTQYAYGGTAGIWNNDSGVLTIYAPQEINLQGNGIDIVSGDATPSLTDGTDFGSVALGGTIVKTFTIQNTGGATLLFDSPEILLDEVDGFTITQAPAVSVAPDGSTTFQVTFTPTTTGSDTNILYIQTNDDDENPYIFTVTGTATLAVPVATAGTEVLQTSFLANWNAVPGATGYRLDVSTDPNFETITNTSDLIISEYVEGSSNNKYIEVFNGTGASVNLSDYQLRLYANGTSTPTTTNVLAGTLANNATIVYRNSGATIYAGATTVLTSVGYNGDDAMALYKISTSSFVDIFGTIGEDPGTAWTSGAFSTLDKTLVRKATVAGGITSNPGNGFPTLATQWTQSNIDVVTNLGSHTYNGVTPLYIPNYNNRDVSNVTSFYVVGLTANTTYYYRVRAVSGGASGNSNPITVLTKPTSVTWNGTAWSNVTGPDEDIEAVIAGVFNSGDDGEFTAKKLTIDTGSLTIAAGTNITLVNEVINNLTDADFVIESNANLIQDNDIDNTGDATVNRDTNLLKRLDYVVWSSPVDNQNLLDFSPDTILTRFYIYNSGTDLYNSVVPSTTTFDEGTGYLIRMPDNHPTTATVFNGIFKGQLNNGNVDVIVDSGTYNAVGNPYPSTIDADLFISANALTEALYFWRKTNSAATSAYATYTTAGGTGTEASPGDPASIIPNGIIQIGQGFIAKATSGTLAFNNQMRVANNDNQFFRNGAAERDRIWLNLTNTQGVFSQTMMAYMTGATQGVDAAIDGLFFNDIQVALTSLIGTAEYAIQGRALPFDHSDIVPLGFKAINAGTYTIGLDHVDGLFTDASQDIFLKDNVTGLLHNLRTGDYTFAAEAGVSNSRFEIVYQTQLAVTNPVWNENQVVVYTQSKNIVINTGTLKMAKVAVYDITGRLVASKENINAFETKIFGGATTQVLIVKITSEDNQVVTKKVTN
jgi:hypothetical protein